MAQPRLGQGICRILRPSPPPLPPVRRAMDVHENQYSRVLMRDMQESNHNLYGGSRSEVVTKTGFLYRSVAAQWSEGTRSEPKPKDPNVKTTANGFRYRSVAAIWDKDEERKSDIHPHSHSRPVAGYRERYHSSASNNSPPSTRRRSRSPKGTHHSRTHGREQRHLSEAMRNVNEFNLGLRPTNKDEEERKRIERAKRFALSGSGSSTGGGRKKARKGRS
ncbi:hypothetical protein K440DRAFT_665213 [Wilcoxina mikolae CBS 423.85]|nr:hypothetical protein K440DRAFT_665213 [Wilcoxina mikolae CBS 423.85]